MSKSAKVSKKADLIVLLLLSAHAERVGVSCMQDLKKYDRNITLTWRKKRHENGVHFFKFPFSHTVTLSVHNTLQKTSH